MERVVTIGGRKIGGGNPVFIVAEMSANHHRSLETAVRIIREAKKAGADAVKLQTYTPDTMTIDSDKPPFTITDGPWKGYRLYDLYREAYTPWEWHPVLKEAARGEGIILFSTPFDVTAVDFLEDMGAPAYKIASFELTDIELLRKVAGTGKPIIVSTGMAGFDEIAEAVGVLGEAGCSELVLLKCTSAYPARPEDMNLRTIPHLAETFGVPVGLSDHTMSPEAALAAVALGACVVEKHFTLSRSEPGPDSAFSLEPAELSRLVRSIRTVERSLGGVSYTLSRGERNSRIFRRSIFAVKDIREGEKFTRDNVRVIRPGHGLAPVHLPEVLGCTASRDIERGTPITWELLRGP